MNCPRSDPDEKHTRQASPKGANHKEVPWLDLGLYHENRCRVPAAYLEPYRGQFVAWSLDGTRILASAKTEAALWKRLRAAGIDPGQVVGDYIDPPDAIYY